MDDAKTEETRAIDPATGSRAGETSRDGRHGALSNRRVAGAAQEDVGAQQAVEIAAKSSRRPLPCATAGLVQQCCSRATHGAPFNPGQQSNRG